MNNSKQFDKSKGRLLNLGHIITMPIASIMGLFSLVATQAMHGDESAAGLLLSYVGGWFLVYGFGVLLPKLFTRTARKSAVEAFVVFGAGGGVAGCFIAFLLMTHNLGGSPGAVFEDAFIAILLPWLLGAAFWFVGRGLQNRTSSQD